MNSEQIAQPLNWPAFPLLPVKRKRVNDLPQLGVIYWWHSQEIEDGGLVRIYLTNMFQFRHTPENPAPTSYEYLTYNNTQSMLDDGWVVD